MSRLKKSAINSIIFELENGEIESGCSSADEDDLPKVNSNSTRESSSNITNGAHILDQNEIQRNPAVLPSMDGDNSHSTDTAVKCINAVRKIPTIIVKFKDKRTAKAYKSKIKKYITSLVLHKSPSAITYDSDTDDELKIWSSDEDCKTRFKTEDVTDAFDSNMVSSNSRPSTIEEDDIRENDVDCEANLFVLDTEPTKTNDHSVAPVYKKKFEVLDNTVNEKAASPKASFGRNNKCFNCDGAHSLRDCREPKNYQKINQNRKAMMTRPGRYHVEEQNKVVGSDGGVIAGRISGALRNALGLQKNQLPLHIYRMRMLGYPPGWLMNAKITHSGITIFDSEGKEVADPEDEDGEIIHLGSKDKYDSKKILDFPGFNVPPSSRYTDESEFYRCPLMSENDSKIIMLEKLAPRMAKAYRRKKIIRLQQSAAERLPGDMNVDIDMDLDDEGERESEAEAAYVNGSQGNSPFVPPLPALPVPSPPPPPPPTSLPGEESPCRRISPSLDDLESRKMMLLAALDEGSRDSSTKIPPESPVKTSNDLKDPTQTTQTTENINEPPETEIPCPITPTTPKVGGVRESSLGTPMMSTTTPYNKLPDDVSFAKDICDIINFENLPDSTGKYLQMSGIIKKVRSAVSKIQQEP